MNLDRSFERKITKDSDKENFEKKEKIEEIPVVVSETEKEKESLQEVVDSMVSDTDKHNVAEFNEEIGAERFFAKKRIAEYVAGTFVLKNSDLAMIMSQIDLKQKNEDIKIDSGASPSAEEIGASVADNIAEEKLPASSCMPIVFLIEKIEGREMEDREKIAREIRDVILNIDREDNLAYRNYMDAVKKGSHDRQEKLLPNPKIRIGLVDSEGKPAFKLEVTSPWGLDSLDSVKKIPEAFRNKLDRLTTIEGCIDFIKENILMMDVWKEKEEVGK